LWNRYDRNLTASSPPDYMDRRRESRLLDAIAAIRERPGNLAADGGARRVQVSRVTADFFRVMGVDPLTGPVAFPSETAGPADRVAVLSFGLWQSEFRGAEVLGRSLRVDGESYVVTGVMPESFDYPPRTEVFLPLVFTPAQLADNFRGNEYLSVIGRAKPAVTLEELDREMNAIALSVLERVPERREFLKRNRFGGAVVPLRERLVGESRAALKLLFAAVLVVLLATGGTVAHLLLAAGSARSHELSVRSSLGATRRSLLAQLVTESVLLSVAGGVVGLALAFCLVRAAPGFVGSELPGISEVSLDARAVLFTLAVALAMGILCGLVPAWQAASGAPKSATRSSASRRARRTRSAFVVSEVALALVLMFAAGLLVRSLQRLSSRDPGFEPEGRLSFALDFPRTLYPRYEERLDLAWNLRESFRALPGVSSVSASARIPLDGRQWTGTFHSQGYQPAEGEPMPGAEFNVVTSDYLKTLGVPLLRGREFEETDTAATTAVVLVDEWT
ncbi:MAG: ABC transporter permease, partial [Vicinamibacteria bacterium]